MFASASLNRRKSSKRVATGFGARPRLVKNFSWGASRQIQLMGRGQAVQTRNVSAASKNSVSQLPPETEPEDRAAAIREMAAKAGVPELADELIREGISADSASRRILTAACIRREYSQLPDAIRRVVSFESYMQNRDR